MSEIRVALGERSYAIVTAGSYTGLPGRLERLGLSRHGWVISHPSLLRRYGQSLLGPLRRAGWMLGTITVPESEASKSLGMAERVFGRLLRRPSMRVPVLFAFGGGVVGDLTGFVAAVFRRGVPYVQVPTTLLGQVDSAIGGKVAVDTPQVKNIIGAFYQPRLVCNNVSVLGTLPLRQRRSGLAEVIKYGVIADRRLFTFLERHLDACLSLQPHAVRVMVERSCRIKADVVSRDERETKGIRARLNFGHTIGHALEAATGYRRWTHGEAIAVGMCAASHLACEVGLMPAAERERVKRLIQAAGLPTQARGIACGEVLRALQYDKKFVHGRARWVLPTQIGDVTVTEEVPPALVRRILARYLGSGDS